LPALELVTWARPRLAAARSRYIKDVLQRADQIRLPGLRSPITARDLRLPAAVTDLFLCFLCQRDHRALRELMESQSRCASGDAHGADCACNGQTRGRGGVASAARSRNQLFNVPVPRQIVRCKARTALRCAETSARESAPCCKAARAVGASWRHCRGSSEEVRPRIRGWPRLARPRGQLQGAHGVAGSWRMTLRSHAVMVQQGSQFARSWET